MITFSINSKILSWFHENKNWSVFVRRYDAQGIFWLFFLDSDIIGLSILWHT